MKIGLLQYDPVWEDKDKNRDKILWMMEKSEAQTDLLLLPELTLTGFTMKSNKYFESLDGETFKFYSELCTKFNTNIIGGLIEKSGSKFYNSLIHVDKNGKLISVYHKIHPFTFSTENKHYSRGAQTVVTTVDEWKTGLSVCYDLRFPELYRQYGKQKTELLVCIANWPDTRIEHWRTLLKARAIENQCFVAGVNRVGNDPKLHYTGFSSVFDPMGKEIITLWDEEKILFTEISKEVVDETRKQLPFLDDITLI
jgi:omega-amidase